MSDWDFINEEMGGWDEDGLPNFMSDPNFMYGYRQAEKMNQAKLKTVKELSELIKKTPEEMIDILDGIGIKKKSANSLITLEDREKMWKAAFKK